MKKGLLAAALVCMTATNVFAEKVDIKLVNLNCQNCVNRVMKVFEGNKAVSKVDTDLKTKTVTITFDEKKTSKEEVTKMLTDNKFILAGSEAAKNYKHKSCGKCKGGNHKHGEEKH